MKLFRDVIIVIKAAGIYLALFAFCQRRGQFQTKKQENSIQCHLEKKKLFINKLVGNMFHQRTVLFQSGFERV